MEFWLLYNPVSHPLQIDVTQALDVLSVTPWVRHYYCTKPQSKIEENHFQLKRCNTFKYVKIANKKNLSMIRHFSNLKRTNLCVDLRSISQINTIFSKKYSSGSTETYLVFKNTLVNLDEILEIVLARENLKGNMKTSCWQYEYFQFSFPLGNTASVILKCV